MPVALLPNRRRKTTTLTHYGHVETKPRDLQSRVLSPTRRHNPQPLGLVYQSPLHCNAQVCTCVTLLKLQLFSIKFSAYVIML